MNIDRRRFLKGLATLPLLPACSDTAKTDLAPPAAVSEIKILTQSWGSSLLIGKIGELLLREQLGQPASSVSMAEGAIWAPLTSGEAHACLEVWPLRNAEGTRAYADTGKVSVLGSYASGRSAWFVPKYVVDRVPTIMTATTSGALPGVLQQAGITQLIVGPTDWITPTPARLGALGVGSSLPVSQAGSEKALLDQVRQAYDAKTPFMVSLWYPHPIHALFDLRAVGLPAAAGCGDIEATPFGCDYPAEPIVKVAWSGLKYSNPDVVAFFNAFAPPIDGMIQLLAASNDTPEVLARNWIKTAKNSVLWQPWLSAARSAKK